MSEGPSTHSPPNTPPPADAAMLREGHEERIEGMSDVELAEVLASVSVEMAKRPHTKIESQLMASMLRVIADEIDRRALLPHSYHPVA